MPLSDVNLIDPDRFLDGPPHGDFALLRREAPVFWHENPAGEGFWVLTRYHDVWKVSLDQHTFSSARRGPIQIGRAHV